MRSDEVGRLPRHSPRIRTFPAGRFIGHPIEQAEAFAEQLEALHPTPCRPLRLPAAITGYNAPRPSHVMCPLLPPEKAQGLIRTGSFPGRHARCLITLPSVRDPRV